MPVSSLDDKPKVDLIQEARNENSQAIIVHPFECSNPSAQVLHIHDIFSPSNQHTHRITYLATDIGVFTPILTTHTLFLLVNNAKRKICIHSQKSHIGIFILLLLLK